MPTYEIILRGDNFLIETNDRRSKCGFYATRTVAGETLEAAELCAVDLIREQLQDHVLNDTSDTPVMALEGYNILPVTTDAAHTEEEFTFFRVAPNCRPAPQPPTPVWWRWFGKS